MPLALGRDGAWNIIEIDEVMKLRNLVVLVLFATIGLVGGFIFLETGSKGVCEKLQDASSNTLLMERTWDRLNDRARVNEFIQSRSDMSVIYVRDLDGDLGIDWESIGIPLLHATVSIGLDKVGLKVAHVGFGYRKYLVFSEATGMEGAIPAFTVEVVCE